MFCVYVLESEQNGELYTGFTAKKVPERLAEHNQGLNPSTKRYRPWRVIYCEACIEESDARRREGYLKTTQGRRLLKRRLRDYFYKKKSKDLAN